MRQEIVEWLKSSSSQERRQGWMAWREELRGLQRQRRRPDRTRAALFGKTGG